MFQVSKDAKLDADLIRKAINYCKKHRERYDRLDRYYGGHHDILDRQKPDEILMNNKVLVNHAKYITDVATGYLLGNPVDYQVNEGIDIQPILDAYKTQTMENIDFEIAKECSIFGHKYEYVYANENAEPCSVPLDVRNALIIVDNTMAHNKLYGMNYRPVFDNGSKDEPDYFEVTIATKDEIINYQLNNDALKEISRDKHFFGEVPLIEYKNNGELSGDFEPVISLIDAYNLIQSDRVNDREQLVDAILCFYGMSFAQEQMDELKRSRALSGIPQDGKVEYLTKAINEGDVDVLRKTIEQDIHKISMVPNMSDQNFVGNASGVALRYKLLTFEQMVKNKERYFEKALMERFHLYNNFLIKKSSMQEVPVKEVDAVFKRNLPSNDYETSQMIANLRGVVDDELLVAQLSFVDDASETVRIAKEEADEELDEADEMGFGGVDDINATNTPQGTNVLSNGNEA
ncbi:phage portal protein [Candidatus Saccharibacteria bacterium]|nr:phage portal protein [Candidatus Saccharibacteria bacterium]